MNVTITAIQQDMRSDEITKKLADLYNAPEDRFADLARALIITKQPYVLLENVEENLAAEHIKALSELGFQCQTADEFNGLSLVPVEQSESEVALCPACDQPSGGAVQCPNCDVVIDKYLKQKEFDEKFQRESKAVTSSEITYEMRIKERSEKSAASKKTKKQSKKTEDDVEALFPEDHLADGSVSANDKTGKRMYAAVASVCLAVIATGFIVQGLVSKDSENDDPTVDSIADSATTTNTGLVAAADPLATGTGTLAPEDLIALAGEIDTELSGSVVADAGIASSSTLGAATLDASVTVAGSSGVSNSDASMTGQDSAGMASADTSIADSDSAGAASSEASITGQDSSDVASTVESISVAGLTDTDSSGLEATLTTMPDGTSITGVVDQGSTIVSASSADTGISIEDITSINNMDINLSDIPVSGISSSISSASDTGISIEDIASISNMDMNLSDIPLSGETISISGSSDAEVSSENPSDVIASRAAHLAEFATSTLTSETSTLATKRLNGTGVNSSSFLSVDQQGILDYTPHTIFSKKWQQEKTISALQQRVKRWHQRDMMATAAVIVASQTDPIVRFSGTQAIIKFEGLKGDNATKLTDIHTLARSLDSDIDRMDALLNLSSTYKHLKLHEDAAKIDDEVATIKSNFTGSLEERVVTEVMLAKHNLNHRLTDTALFRFQSAKAHVASLDDAMLANSAISYIALSEATQGLPDDANNTSIMITNTELRSSLQAKITQITASQTDLKMPEQAAAHPHVMPQDAQMDEN